MKMKRTLTTLVALAAILAGAPAGSSAPAVHPLLVH